MKKGFLFFIAICACFISKANEIDNLRTDADVINFIKPLLESKFQINSIDLSFGYQDNPTCKNLPANDGFRKWDKIDFNNDGLTDLFLNIYLSNERVVLAIIAINNSYKVISLNRMRAACQTGYATKLDDVPVIIIAGKSLLPKSRDTITTDTIRYSTISNSFIDYKKQYAPYNIESVEFATTGCFGACPVLTLKVNDKGLSQYNAIENNKLQGKFSAAIDNSAKNPLFQLLNEIDFVLLKDNYAVAWTDQQAATLKITYNNGQVKTIEDYGMKGSFGLVGVYSMLLSLRESIPWQKAN